MAPNFNTKKLEEKKSIIIIEKNKNTKEIEEQNSKHTQKDPPTNQNQL